MPTNLRAIVSERQTIPGEVLNALTPLEEGANDQAIGISALKTLLLMNHGQAKLPISVGGDVLALLNEAAFHAEQHRAKLGDVHAALKPIAARFFIHASGANCPPNEPMQSNFFEGA